MTLPPTPLVPAAWGELFDKITILEIKTQRLTAPAALANVARELELLAALAAPALMAWPGVAALKADLLAVNAALWDIEEGKRDCERRGDFGVAFVELARAVYIRNDERAAIKRAINDLTGSALVEEKSYAPYLAG